MNITSYITAVGLFVSSSLYGSSLDEKFVKAIHQVESSGRTGKVIGDGGKALGPLQIHKAYFKDAVSYDKSLKNDYSKVTDLGFAKKVMSAYLNKYAPDAVRNDDYETLARIHNGGPMGHRNPDTVDYWKKVKKNLK